MQKKTYLDDRFIEEVKNSNNIVDIISKYVDLKKNGDNYKGLCPFHNEKTPSFSVNERKQIFKCFGCNESGNVISFIMKKENMGFIDSIKHLCDIAHITFPKNDANYELIAKNNEKKSKMYNLHLDLAKYYFENMKKNIDNCTYYLLDRGIDQKTILKFGLGYEGRKSNSTKYLLDLGYSEQDLLDSMIFKKKDDRVYCIFFSRLIYPIFDTRNRVVAFGARVIGKGEPKYLNSPENLIFKKKDQLYGLNLTIKYKSKRLILVEGYMDVIRLNQKGIIGAIASLGTSLTFQQSEIIKKQNKKVYICYDSDKAGRLATIRAIDILKQNGIKAYIINLGSSKDPDEFFNTNTSQDFMSRIKNAISSLSFILDDMAKDYDLSIESQKIEYVDKVCEKIKDCKDPVEIEYQIKRISSITNISIKSIGTKVYGKYFSAKQFENTKNINKNIQIKTIPDIHRKNKDINKENLFDIISKKPDCISYIMDILDIQDIDDDNIKKYYQEFSSKNVQKVYINPCQYKTIRKLAILTKINILQNNLKKLENTQFSNSDLNHINIINSQKIDIIKNISKLKEYIKGLI